MNKLPRFPRPEPIYPQGRGTLGGAVLLAGLIAIASFALAVVLVGCAPVTVLPPLGQPARAVKVSVCAAGASVRLGAPQIANPPQVTDANGDTIFEGVPADLPSGMILEVNLPGRDRFTEGLASVRPVYQHFILGACAPFTDAGLQVQLRAWIQPMVPLVVRNRRNFGLADGGLFYGIETSEFNAYNRWLRGEDIRPVLQQRKDIGFNMLRVWTFYDLPIANIGVLLDPQYPRIPAFTKLVAEYGLYINFTAYTGPYPRPFPMDHWGKLCAAVQGQPNVILSLVNEVDQPVNVMDYTLFAKCPGVLSSRGSNGSQSWPPEPHMDWAGFHTNGAFEWWRKVGHNGMEIEWEFGLPVHAEENTRYADNEQSIEHAYDASAAAALLIAAATYHSTHGKNSTLFEGIELQAAKAWADGAKSVPLRCQNAGGYVHRIDLEGPNDLRVYQRGNDPACIVRIRQ